MPPFIEYNEPRISFMSVRTNDAVSSRTSDVDLSTANNTIDSVNNTLNANEGVDQNNDDNQNIILRPPPLANEGAFSTVSQEDDQ